MIQRESARSAAAQPSFSSSETPILITGGAGFIGANVAHRLALDGHRVLILDNLSRPDVAHNVEWLKREHGTRVEFCRADIRDASAVRDCMRNAEVVFHFAAQVAVTTSLTAPMEDFEVNLHGTLNVLEALRQRSNPPPLLFTSTNKVYGNLEDVALRETASRYEPISDNTRSDGISEQRALNFHCPYGCSKGAADQYVLDYARQYDLPTVVFRMSCIYGVRQFGTEDQGWVAHFLINSARGRKLALYGDGKQVRDLLYIDDLVSAMLLAVDQVDALRGRAFNIGGGPASTVSLLELLDLLEELHGTRPEYDFNAWRQGDQRYYVSDTTAFRKAAGWEPRVGVREGLRRLSSWIAQLPQTLPADKRAEVLAV